MSAMFSQDFFLAIILQDSSPGEGRHGAGHNVGWGWQGGQRRRRHELGRRDGVVVSARGGRGMSQVHGVPARAQNVCLRL